MQWWQTLAQRKKWALVFLVLVTGLAAGCGRVSGVPATPSPASSPTAAPPTPVPTATPVPLPTATPVPLPTATPKPTWRQVQRLTVAEQRWPSAVGLRSDARQVALGTYWRIGDPNAEVVPLVQVWNIGQEKPLWETRPQGLTATNGGWIKEVRWLPQAQKWLVLGGNWDGWRFSLLDPQNGQTVWSQQEGWPPDDDWDPEAVVNPVTNELWFNTPGFVLKRLNLQDLSTVKTVDLAPDQANCCMVYAMTVHDGRMWAVARELYVTHYKLLSWPLEGGPVTQVDMPELHSNGLVRDMAFNDRGELAIIFWSFTLGEPSDTTQIQIKVFDPQTGEQISRWWKEYDSTWSILWVPGEGWWVPWTFEVRIYPDASGNGRLWREFNYNLEGLVMSEDRRLMALYGVEETGVVEIWEKR